MMMASVAFVARLSALCSQTFRQIFRDFPVCAVQKLAIRGFCAFGIGLEFRCRSAHAAAAEDCEEGSLFQ